MNIIEQKWIFLNSTLVIIPKQVLKLYQFGIEVLALRKIASLRANARISRLTWNTAKSKIYRLTSNPKFLWIFPKLIKLLNIIRPKDTIAVDFSDFGSGIQVLMFAKQTKKGRTLPVYFETLKYPITKGSQNLFIIQALDNFKKLIGFKVKFVFDRGFASPYIIEYLAKERDIFYIRIKKGKSVIDLKTGQKIIVKDATKNDFLVLAYNRKLRLIISDKDGGVLEPWYLITNDFKLSRNKVVENYYYRFEIEEFFRDAKRLLGLEQVQFKTEASLKITLWFVILGLWFLWSLDEKEFENNQRDKMRLSIIRYFLEKIQSEIIQSAEGKFIANFTLNTG